MGMGKTHFPMLSQTNSYTLSQRILAQTTGTGSLVLNLYTKVNFMSDFEALQLALHRLAARRRAEQQACEALLNGLYHALRASGGRGRPLNNVSMEVIPDPLRRMQPVPEGEFHAAWFRLGLCEVLVRVRLSGAEFHGEFGTSGVFSVTDLNDDTLAALARQVLRDVALMYEGSVSPAGQLN